MNDSDLIILFAILTPVIMITLFIPIMWYITYKKIKDRNRRLKKNENSR